MIYGKGCCRDLTNIQSLSNEHCRLQIIRDDRDRVQNNVHHIGKFTGFVDIMLQLNYCVEPLNCLGKS